MKTNEWKITIDYEDVEKNRTDTPLHLTKKFSEFLVAAANTFGIASTNEKAIPNNPRRNKMHQ